MSVSDTGSADPRARSSFSSPSLISLYLPPLRWQIERWEKKRPTYDLEAIKIALGSVSTLAMTSSALRDANSVGFDRSGVVETIAGIEGRMF
ncbi:MULTISPECIES: type II toxin-antitoxin system MqsR family toxin [Pannonibacter]|uniref:type II toxin-antitoxin system MqsR family toxin n=1 Tax=Pannonibacter TaxID=227873 RepID=UPI0018E58415|nr:MULTISPECIES: type II toxin-antitoxin system MqsR family toxin [Pannonibacter]